MRGQARDYDGWGAGDGHGANPGWSWAECLPYFLRHEDFHKGADTFHAAPGFDPTGKRQGGEWRVEKQRLHWPILDAFLAARGRGRRAALRRLQPRRQRRRRLLRRQPARRHSLERDQGVPAAGVSSREPAGLDRRPHPPRRLRQACVRAASRSRRSAAASRSRRSSRPAARSSSRPARSAVRRSCSSRESATRACWRRTASPRGCALPGVGENLQDHLQIRAVYGVEGAKTLNTMAATPWGKALSACATCGRAAAR